MIMKFRDLPRSVFDMDWERERQREKFVCKIENNSNK